MSAVGVDPGATSGAVVWLATDTRTVRFWWAWERQGAAADYNSYRLRDAVSAEATGLALHELLTTIAVQLQGMGAAPALLAVEGLFIPQRTTKAGPTSPGNVQALHLAAGMAVQAFGFLRPARAPHRPSANEWRSRQLDAGAAALDAKRVEALAVTRACQVLRWPDVRDLDALTAVERGAVCEAAWIARDALTRTLSPEIAPPTLPLTARRETDAELLGRVP